MLRRLTFFVFNHIMGGYGPVSERDPELLRRELQEGIIDEQWQEEAGVALT